MITCDLAVIGAGPGGYVASIRAAQLGLRVVCIEKESALGGTCLRIGCIPSKALLESSEHFHRTQTDLARHGVLVQGVALDLAAMMKRKTQVVAALTQGVAGLFKKNKIERLQGAARIAGKDGERWQVAVGDEQVSAKWVLIATGSEPAALPGIVLDGDLIGTSTEALSYPSVPKHLVVIGAGVIGLELGSVWRRLGAKVTVLEYADRILPSLDRDVSEAAKKVFVKQGIEFRLGVRVTAATASAGLGHVAFEANGTRQELTCDRVLVAVGRTPHTAGLGLVEAGVELDTRGRIVTRDHFATTATGIFAIGDVIAGPMLAHKAEDEGMACAERLATGYGHVDYTTIAAVVYTDPEIATVGASQEDLIARGIAFKVGSFPFMANGRARAMGSTDGFVKILADAASDRVLGAAIVGPHASELIAEVATAMAFGASSEDIARTCHAHPTLSEAVREAALAVDGRAIHA